MGPYSQPVPQLPGQATHSHQQLHLTSDPAQLSQVGGALGRAYGEAIIVYSLDIWQ